MKARAIKERTEHTMNTRQRTRLRGLQGRVVHLALADGSRIDDAVLMSAGSRTVWVFLNGEDTFITLHDLIDVWETGRVGSAA
jgi:hypothetical protein